MFHAFAEQEILAAGQRERIRALLGAREGSAPIVELPCFPTDVHDLEGLVALGRSFSASTA
jgi:hypothetical protein